MLHKKLYIGTSGWGFKSWIGEFYPQKIAQHNMLKHYAKSFQTVELNNSFYRLPEKQSILNWKESTPDNFLFSCKASRYITHMKKLREPEQGIRHLFKSLEFFGKKLGPILFQFPPNWHLDLERLQNFIKALPENHRYTMEFREKSWLCQRVYDLLDQYKIALCFYDYRGYQSPEVATGDFIYVRLHGPEQQAYQGSYDGRTLAGYAQKFLRWLDEGKVVFCYFDNDRKACAPHDAKRLQESIERQT